MASRLSRLRQSLDGIQIAPALGLFLADNSITDISALSRLASPVNIDLYHSLGLTDISVLNGITSLEYLSRNDNAIVFAQGSGAQDPDGQVTCIDEGHDDDLRLEGRLASAA